LHNPHVETHFKSTVFNVLTKRFSHKKYGYLLDYFLENKDVEVLIYADEQDTSFGKKKIPVKLEVYLWCLFNGINPLSVDIIFDKGQISGDVFFLFAFRNLDKKKPFFDDELLDILNRNKIFRVIHLTHYLLGTGNISQHARDFGVDLFVAENNLFKNSLFFKKCFPFYNKDVHTLPFVYQSRFVKRTNFEARKIKCLATGTFEILGNTSRTEELRDYFGVQTVHPMRKEIFQSSGELSKYIDSYISDFNESSSKEINDTDLILKKIANKLHNIFFVKQSKYFKFDIVEKYNEYMMFVVPEEINDLPAIGFIEGMACGCAYIGKVDPMYKDIGLVPGEHYIGYDGTLDDLVAKIKFYQGNLDELRQIAERGYKFVVSKFNNKAVAENFLAHLNKVVSDNKCSTQP
jgi:hypothetical protein